MLSISIIIPSYNRCELIKDCLASLLSQNYSPKEVIIIDDYSTDETLSYCHSQYDAFKATGIDLIILESNENLGAQVARNRGILASTGTHIMFMDSDDVLKENALEKFAHAFNQENIDFVYSQVIKTDSSLNPINTEIVGSTYDPVTKELSGYHWQTMGAVYTRNLINKVGYWNEALTGSQDWEYQARIKIHAESSFFINEPLAYWRQHDGERVGASTFRADYVRSVVLACESIRKHATEHGYNSPELEWSLAKRLCLHALEYKINAHPNEALKISKIIKDYKLTSSQHIILQALILSPKFLSKLIWRKLSQN